MTNAYSPTADDLDTWSALAAATGVQSRPQPVRRWVQSPNAGHLSGLVWGSGNPDVVLVHDLGGSSNEWDLVALASTRSIVALDLAGHGHSSTAQRVAPPSRQSPALIDALRSFAPGVRLTVASGLGAAIALQVTLKRPQAVGALLVIDGALGGAPWTEWGGVPTVDAAAALIGAEAPHHDPAFVRHLAIESTVPRPDGGLDWRYQLGAPPAEYEGWLSVDKFDVPAVPLAVVTAASGTPSDPLVTSILDRWPDTLRFDVPGADTGFDLVGVHPLGVADAIEHFLTSLESTDAPEGASR